MVMKEDLRTIELCYNNHERDRISVCLLTKYCSNRGL